MTFFIAVASASVLFGLIVYLHHVGQRRPAMARRGWHFIVSGLSLLLLGSIFDVFGTFGGFDRVVMVGDVTVEASLISRIGFVFGIGMVGVGLIRWSYSLGDLSDHVARLGETEKVLRQSEERLRLIADTVPIGIGYVDAGACVP